MARILSEQSKSSIRQVTHSEVVRRFGETQDLNAHEAGNGGKSQGKPRVHCGLLYSAAFSMRLRFLTTRGARSRHHTSPDPRIPAAESFTRNGRTWFHCSIEENLEARLLIGAAMPLWQTLAQRTFFLCEISYRVQLADLVKRLKGWMRSSFSHLKRPSENWLPDAPFGIPGCQ